MTESKKYFKLYVKSKKIITPQNLEQSSNDKSEDYEITLEDNNENRKFVMLLTRVCMREDVITDIGF